jgi:hypothetical protein
MEGSPEQIVLRVQALTGQELDDRGAVRDLTFEEWEDRRHNSER